MNAYNQAIYLPLFFKVSPGCAEATWKYIAQHGIGAPSVVILSGANFSRKVAGDIANAAPAMSVEHFIVEAASARAVADLHQLCLRAKAALILSIGGGTVIDVGKRLHKLHHIPNIVIPTIISNDGLISPISVLRDEAGLRNSWPAAMPVGVIVDMKFVRQAPLQYLQAAAGDLLSNISACHDWLRLSDKVPPVETINDLAYQLALGAEHLLSHAIDNLGLAPDILHGKQVGAIVPYFYLCWAERSRQPRPLQASSACLSIGAA